MSQIFASFFSIRSWFVEFFDAFGFLAALVLGRLHLLDCRSVFSSAYGLYLPPSAPFHNFITMLLCDHCAAII